MDAGFVQIGLAQLSQSVKAMNATHAHAERQTTLLMALCTHPGSSKEVNETMWPLTHCRPCAFKKKNVGAK